MRTPSFLKHAGIYAVGDVLVMAAGFVLLPLYTRCLSLTEFGTLEVLERVGEIAAICLVARGIPLAVIALYRQSETEIERQRVVGSGFLVAGTVIGAGAAVLAVLAGPLGAWLQLDDGLLLWTATSVALLDGLGMISLATHQARLESGFYIAIACGQFLFKVLLCLLFVLVLGLGIWGIVAASLLRTVLLTSIVLVREWRQGIAWPDRQALRRLLSFALPFVPTGLCFFVLNSADRFFLVRHADQDTVGLYGLGYRLGMLVGFFSLGPLYRVWSAHMYDVAGTPEAPVTFGRVATYLLAAYLFVGLGLCLFQDEVILLFAGEAFAGSAGIVAPVVLAYWCNGMGVLFDAGLYVRRQTKRKLWIALASTGVMLLFYATMIPAWGAMGAAGATLGGFAFHAALTYRIAQQAFPVRHEPGRWLAMLLLAGSIWAVSREVGSDPASLIAKAGLWWLWPVLLWLTGVITAAEKRQVFAIGRQLCHHLPIRGRRKRPGLARFRGHVPS